MPSDKANYILSFLASLRMILVWQVILWYYCLHLWLSNVYFCENTIPPLSGKMYLKLDANAQEGLGSPGVRFLADAIVTSLIVNLPASI